MEDNMYVISSSDSDEEWYDRPPKKLKKLRSKYGINSKTEEQCDIISIHSNEDKKIETNCGSRQDPDVIELFDYPTNVVNNKMDTANDGVVARSKRRRKKSDIESSPKSAKKGTKRGRGRGRGKGSTVSVPAAPLSRGRGKRGRLTRQNTVSDILTLDITTPSPRKSPRIQKRANQRHSHVESIIYSIGNTFEYPDASDDQVLFNNKKVVNEPSATIDLIDTLDNEELSVKVLWQLLEVFKFNIRRHQKITQIFDFFATKTGVSRDRLLFTYDIGTRNRFLRPDDTPDSIDYNIAKFIDGGIVNNRITHAYNTPQKSGFIIKFQCQNKKKPFELSVGKDEQLQLAMVKCAEHLEISLTSLVFEFDGEVIRGSSTPNSLDMESGDCIDVKIINVNK